MVDIPLQIPVSGNPGLNGGVRLGGWVAPTDYSDEYAQTSDIFMQGGLQVHQTLADRNAIIEARRKFGMLVFVRSENKLYQLQDIAMGGVDNDIMNNSNWIVFVAGGGGSGSIVFPIINQTEVIAEHNKGTGITYAIYDADGKCVDTLCEVIDSNNLKVSFLIPFTGTLVIV